MIKLNVFVAVVCLFACFAQAQSNGKSFGERQVTQMLADRPEMQDAIPLSHPVFAKLASGFDGKLKGQRIYWVNTNPSNGKVAGHFQPYSVYPPHILITDNPSIAPIDKWAAAVFELHNVEEDFNALAKKVALGTLGRAEFVQKSIELEANALNKTRLFFQKNPLPADSKCKWYKYFIGDGLPVALEKDISDIRRANGGYFSRYFDRIKNFAHRQEKGVRSQKRN